MGGHGRAWEGMGGQLGRTPNHQAASVLRAVDIEVPDPVTDNNGAKMAFGWPIDPDKHAELTMDLVPDRASVTMGLAVLVPRQMPGKGLASLAQWQSAPLTPPQAPTASEAQKVGGGWGTLHLQPRHKWHWCRRGL